MDTVLTVLSLASIACGVAIVVMLARYIGRSIRETRMMSELKTVMELDICKDAIDRDLVSRRIAELEAAIAKSDAEIARLESELSALEKED